jgi:hypothetical protein
MKKLKLTIKQIRGLQEKHGVKNLLSPGPEDAAKLASLDFLVDMYYEGSRSWTGDTGAAPSRDEVEETDFRELLEAVQGFLSGKAEGNG